MARKRGAIRQEKVFSASFNSQKNSDLFTTEGQEAREAIHDRARFGQFEESGDGKVEKSVWDEDQGGEQERVASSDE